MINQILNSELIDAIKEKTQEKINLANTLMEILHLGKEATYRRLRGEVPFTLSEAIAISHSIGISIDKIAGSHINTNAFFNLNMVSFENPSETYYAIINKQIKIFSLLINDPTSELGASSNIIPQTLYLQYNELSKFRLFKWMYQHEKVSFCKRYEDFELSPKLLQCQKDFVKMSQLLHKSYYIWDREIFQHLVNDIKYFSSIHLISEESVKALKKDFLQMLNEVEHVATTGQFSTGKEVQLYIANTNFEATYSYVKSTNFHLSMIRVFSINSITSKDDMIFDNLKEWIQSLKKYSILISQSGEIQRIEFFKEQRKLVESL